MKTILYSPLIAMIWLYQHGISPFTSGACRFHPSCSCYAREAIDKHGGCRGSWLALKRIARCHPFGGSGIDPVPSPDNEKT